MPTNLADFFENIPEELKPLFEEIDEVWEVLPKLNSFIKSILKPGNEGSKVGDVYIDADVWIGKGTVVEHGAMIKGPAIIGENCQIRNGAYIRGGVFVADDCVVGHCTELKNSILMNGAHLGHFNYAGDSILGQKVNLGAGSILANLRFDEKEIKIGETKTGLKKIGGILGDNCKLGCNTVLNPGTVFKKDLTYSGKPLKSGVYEMEDLAGTHSRE